MLPNYKGLIYLQPSSKDRDRLAHLLVLKGNICFPGRILGDSKGLLPHSPFQEKEVRLRVLRGRSGLGLPKIRNFVLCVMARLTNTSGISSAFNLSSR